MMDTLSHFPPTLFILLYVVAAFGFYLILGQSKITLPIRKWAFDWKAKTYTPLQWLVTLVECPMCLGFWCGVVTTALWFGMPLCADYPLLPIVVGCVTSATNTVLFALVDAFNKED